ncbi:unnamed protein product [Heligmosomoides polygyrus]|uniref:Secreted protein n=1 Tax=Heligmosomoides polygyrus TaxID=6339 RepID=A0A183FJ86_HELPZ|nr:unnamed protein product [Heligmosomoides polygyrus]
MDDVAVSSSFESGLSMLLSACAPPLSLDDDFSLGWDCLDRSKDVKSGQSASLSRFLFSVHLSRRLLTERGPSPLVLLNCKVHSISIGSTFTEQLCLLETSAV